VESWTSWDRWKVGQLVQVGTGQLTPSGYVQAVTHCPALPPVHLILYKPLVCKKVDRWKGGKAGQCVTPKVYERDYKNKVCTGWYRKAVYGTTGHWLFHVLHATW
jgi:hypothetical protein